MADSARIEDLRKRYHENPRRFFAPLANEYRKAGFLDRAILLCQKHLAEQPENMNGLVVFGQTLFEAGNLEEARAPFERALGLDPENLIALKHLGDIARLSGDQALAKVWYEKLLELDRRNDEVQALMAELRGPIDTPEPPVAPVSSPLVTVASSVSVRGGEAFEAGMIQLDGPSAEPPAKPPAGPGSTKVIDAQSLANQDRAQAELVGAETLRIEPAPAAAEPPKGPAARMSLLDVDFDFGELGETASAPSASSAPTVELSPLPEPPSAPAGPGDLLDISDLQIESSPEGEPLAPAAESATPADGGMAGLELAEFSTEVAPLAGLEATEFSAETVAPLDGLDVPDTTGAVIAPLAGLDTPFTGEAELAPPVDIDALPTASAELAAAEPIESQAEPEVERVSAELPDSPIASFELPDAPDVEVLPGIPSSPPVETPRPRMTRADLASLPLLADFGLEDDEPAAPVETTAAAAQPEAVESVAADVSEPAGAEQVATAATSATPASTPKTPAIVTETMATLYLRQGHRDEAIAVYRQLVEQSPDDAALRARLEALEAAAADSAAASEMPEFEPPSAEVEPEPLPAGAAFADVSFAEVGLRTPTTETPVIEMPAAAGPTAREFFAGIARRVAAARAAAEGPEAAADGSAPPSDTEPAEASGWPLDALFGAATDARDAAAAAALAGIATFTGPDGGTGLDALFASESQPPVRKSVPRASQSLKFDQFFQTPASSAPTAPPTARNSGDEDLDQFQDWLSGLKP